MTLPTGTTVRIHKNLNRQKQGLPDQWSVCTKQNVNGRNVWRLHHHTETITLSGAEPIVSVTGSERIRKNQSREVVARIEGTIVSDRSTDSEWRESVDTVKIRYNAKDRESNHFTKGYTDSVFTYADIAYFPSKTAYFLAI